MSALLLASEANNSEVSKALIKGGANLDFQDKKGWTALHCAASAGFLDVVKLLVESGATSEVRSHQEVWTDGLLFRKQPRMAGLLCGTPPVRATTTSSTTSSGRNTTATSCWRTGG